MAVAVVAAFSALFSVASASAVTLKGLWAPFNRCPVDDPSMLAGTYPTGTYDFCLTVESQKGFLKLGGLTLQSGPFNSQMGLLATPEVPVGWPGVLPKDGRGIIASPQTVPGGLTGLACGQHSNVQGDLCTSTTRPERLNRVTSTLESAGAPSNFALFAPFEPGARLITLPVKVHLQNPILGPNCYIGSNAHPIVLQPIIIKEPEGSGVQFNAEGAPESGGLMLIVSLKRTAQADNTFAVGTATGCGAKGRLNDAINRTVGLPSPAGANAVVWNDLSSYVTGFNQPTATNGADLSKYWHEAVIG